MRRLAILAVVCLACLGAVLVFAMADRAEPVILSNAQASPMMGAESGLAVYMTIETGATPDRLLSASSPEAAAVEIIGAASPTPALPATSAVALASDGAHLRLTGVTGEMAEGRLIPISLEFERAGTATTRARLDMAAADPMVDHGGMAMGGEMGAGMGTNDASMPSPEVTLGITPDPEGGWIVRIETAHFTFTPDSPDPRHVPGEGHGHLYLDGVKLQRLYEGRARIGALPPGRYTVTVTLNTNTHMPYRDAQGRPVAASGALVSGTP